jgi:hypothetical protein
MATTAKAIRLASQGGPDVLKLERVTLGDPGQGEVLLPRPRSASISSTSISRMAPTPWICPLASVPKALVLSRQSAPA